MCVCVCEFSTLEMNNSFTLLPQYSAFFATKAPQCSRSLKETEQIYYLLKPHIKVLFVLLILFIPPPSVINDLAQGNVSEIY